MIKSLFLLSTLSITLFLFNSCKSFDSGPKTSKSFPISEFSKLNLEIVGEVNYEQSDHFYLEVNGGTNLIEALTVTNDNGQLMIKLKDKDHFSGNKNDLEFRIGSPNLEKINFNSVGTFLSKNEFKGDELTIVNNGVGEVKMTDCNVENFNLVSNGVGTIKIKGSTSSTYINSQGVGDIDCSQFKSETAIIECSGIGNISVYAQNHIKVNLSGIGSVKYYGNPKEVNSNVSGLGSIKNMDR